VPTGSHSDPVPGWLLNEVASAGRENLDPEHVARYDDKEDARAEEEIALCQALGIGPSSTVVEFGSGTGQFTTAVASTCARVVAVDVSAVMQRRLHAKLKDRGISNVELVRAGFLTYRHAGEPADLVYSRYALHHLPDFWKAVALDRIQRILRPGGILRLSDVVFSFEPGDAEERIESWCATGGPRVETDWSRAELEEHVRDEHSTFSWVLEPMAVRCGFTVESAEYSEDQISTKYILRRT
jgi:ubiquinone/menaquinone biosynthesis C-methylase UbiE